MQVHVLLFAGLRESLGVDRVLLDLPAPGTISDALLVLKERYPALSEQRFMTARNAAYAASDTSLEEGDELALIPPVSGG